MTTPASLNITCAQLNATVGDLAGNANIMLKTWQEHEGESDLIVFPELFLCGYQPEDLIFAGGFMDAVQNEIKRICQESASFSSAALITAPWQDKSAVYNAALLIENGEIQNVFLKHKLPNYDVFDEPRVFKAGDAPKPYDFRGHRLGVLICEDIWYEDVVRDLSAQGVDIILSVNGSPYHTRKYERRLDVLSSASEISKAPIVYLNIIGGQDELVFDGRSMVVDANGDLVAQAYQFQEHIFTVHCGENIDLTNIEKPQAVSKHAEMYEAAILGLKDYVHKNGFKDVVLGLSGGVDSAITTAIAVDAFGAEYVHCIMMPSDFTSSESLEDAKLCADMLGVKYEIIPIKDTLRALENSIDGLDGLAHENTQSRIRGTFLMAVSNKTGAMLLTTGNKSEVAMGYCTLYGDMNGGYNPIKDLYKTEVYDLCHWRNEQGMVIPERILTKAPSAELRPDQKDEDSLPPYDVLDDMLRFLIEYQNEDWNNPCAEAVRCKGVCEGDPETFKRISRLLKIMEYKRFQSAPGARISWRAFGKDRRYPLTNHFVNGIEKPRD